MFQADWTRLGFDDVYPFPEDLLHESQRLHARQRAFTFDLIRANPRINGYNLTGMLDHALTGEGLWTFFRKWKPGTYDAVSEGWSPLRWCLWAHCTHVYAGQALRVEAHLANERALLPGNYSARLRALGPQGVVWDRTLAVAIPKGDVLAVPVLQEPIQIDGPTGEYTLAANLEHGGAPAGGRLKFYVTDARALPQLSGSIATWGVEASAERWLAGHGLICEPWPNATDERGSLVLVGAPSPAERTPARMAMLMAQLAAGATVIFLNRRVFEDGLDSTAYLPLKQRGRAYTAIDYLYHKECVARRHAVFEGLQAPGILDWDYYGPVVPHDVYEGLDTPDETMAASFAVGHHAYANGYCCGLLMGMYRHGAGKFILSTLPLLENLGAHPAADRLLLNLIRYAQSL